MEEKTQLEYGQMVCVCVCRNSDESVGQEGEDNKRESSHLRAERG